MTDQPTLTEIVYSTVSSSNDVVAALDKLLECPNGVFLLPRETLYVIRTLISSNATLSKDLFEANQTLEDHLNKFIKKHIKNRDHPPKD